MFACADKEYMTQLKHDREQLASGDQLRWEKSGMDHFNTIPPGTVFGPGTADHEIGRFSDFLATTLNFRSEFSQNPNKICRHKSRQFSELYLVQHFTKFRDIPTNVHQYHCEIKDEEY